MKLLGFIAVLFCFCLQLSCSASKERQLAAGRCESHDDCPEGNKCVNTRCQDIYYPRSEIKNY